MQNPNHWLVDNLVFGLLAITDQNMSYSAVVGYIVTQITIFDGI